MSELAGKVIAAGRQRIGSPFRHHYKPASLCHNGRITRDECMDRGMDNNGYDCSGFVIASLCDVLQIASREWPRDRRHAWKMQDLVARKPQEPGDIVLVEDPRQSKFHPLLASGDMSVIHADGPIGAVIEETELITPHVIHIIPLDNLVELIR